jgi:hypothetical protein
MIDDVIGSSTCRRVSPLRPLCPPGFLAERSRTLVTRAGFFSPSLDGGLPLFELFNPSGVQVRQSAPSELHSRPSAPLSARSGLPWTARSAFRESSDTQPHQAPLSSASLSSRWTTTVQSTRAGCLSQDQAQSDRRDPRAGNSRQIDLASKLPKRWLVRGRAADINTARLGPVRGNHIADRVVLVSPPCFTGLVELIGDVVAR